MPRKDVQRSWKEWVRKEPRHARTARLFKGFSVALHVLAVRDMRLLLQNRPAVILLTLLPLALVLVALQTHHVNTAQYKTREAIRSLLQPKNVPAYVKVDDDSTEQRMRRFYQKRRNHPAWLTAASVNGGARELLDVLRHAGDQGLPTASYRVEAIEEALDRLRGKGPLGAPEPADLAAIDVLLTHSYLKYAYNVHRGRIHPRALPHDWLARPRSLDYVAQLDQALARSRVRESLEELSPSHEGYRRLRESLGRYREVAERGGWPRIGAGRPLALGARGPRVTALRARLAAEGNLPASAAQGDAFDRTVDRGVKAFQARAGFEVDGRVEADEIAALDVPVENRIRQIELNLERWRWLPADLGGRYLLVNVPEYMLYVHEGGRYRPFMRVIVGDEYTPTPIFSDTLTTMVVNPVWNVPASIATQEIAQEVAQDPTYLQRHGMRVFDATGQEIDPGRVNWSAVTAGEEPGLSVRQDPGENNALGRLKFICPNRFNVYLHDTPQDNLFQAENRDFSHGCIRLEKPLEMAEYLMRGHDGWSRDKIERETAKEGASEQHVKLPEPVPVHILYWTAWADDRGVAHFRDDVYGIDAMLERALRRDPALREAQRAGQAPRGKRRGA